MSFRVVLTASYPASEPPIGYPVGVHTAVQPEQLFGQLIEWSSAQGNEIEDFYLHHGVMRETIDGPKYLDEPEMITTMVYVVDAPSELEARWDAEAIFRESTVAFGLPEPQTLLAVAE